MKTSSNAIRIGWVLVLLTAVVSLYSVALRHRVEARNKAFAPAVEWGTLQMLSGSFGPTPGKLKELRGSGLQALVLAEESIGDLMRQGRLWIEAASDPDSVLLACNPAEPTLISRVERGLNRWLGEDPTLFYEGESKIVIPVSLRPTLEVIPIGIDPQQAAAGREAGLYLIARHSNFFGVSELYIYGTLMESRAHGVSAILPQGDAVLGSRNRLPQTMETMKRLGLVYCSPEFAKMAGEARMTQLNPRNVIRLHAIQAAEVERMSPRDITERFARATGERNQRILLIRPFDAGGDNASQSLSLSLAKITKAVEKEGGAAGTPKTWDDPGVPTWVIPLISLATFGVAVLLVLSMFDSRLWQGLVLLPAAGATALALLGSPTYAATLAAITFPLAAFFWLRAKTRWPAGALVASMVGVSLVGGLAVAGLLNGPEYYVRAEAFFAVKLAHFLPIVIVGAVLAREHLDFKKLAITPITWGALGLLFAVMFGLMFMLARTGNDNPAAVSGIELQIRSLLERVFQTRPRTKEFLIGYPALLIGLILAQRGAKLPDGTLRTRILAGSAMLQTLGMIALTSLVNTMCHLHTPVYVGLVRILIGAVMGVFIGYGVWALLSRWMPREAKA